MGLFSSHNSGQELVFVIDIGDASVGGAIVELAAEYPPRILYTVRRRIANQETLDFNYLVAALKRQIDEICEDMAVRGVRQLALAGKPGKKPDRIVCTLSPLWHSAHMRRVTIARGIPFTITAEVLERAIRKETEEFTSGHSDAHIREGIKEDVLSVIEQKLTEVRVNGYAVDNPEGRTAKRLEFLLFLSVAQNNVVEAVEECAEKHFSVSESAISFHSSTRALYRALRGMKPEEQDFNMVDIGDELTCVSVINGGMLLETATFPLGKNSVVRNTASKLGQTPDEASSFLAHALDEGAKSEETRAVIREQRRIWLEQFAFILQQLSSDLFLPHKVFAVSGDVYADWFIRVLEDEQLHRFTMTDKAFLVERVAGRTLSDFTELGPGARKDTRLCIAALFADALTTG